MLTSSIILRGKCLGKSGAVEYEHIKIEAQQQGIVTDVHCLCNVQIVRFPLFMFSKRILPQLVFFSSSRFLPALTTLLQFGNFRFTDRWLPE